MRIGFYHPLMGNKNIDITLVQSGNPGYGGTQFCFSLIIFFLAKDFKDLQIIVYSDTLLKLPSNCISKIVNGEDELLEKSKCDNVDFLILKTPLTPNFYCEKLIKYNINVICWSHNYFNSHTAKAISKCKQVKSVVFVGKQMYDFYYDNDIIKKSTFIYNPVPDHIMSGDRIYNSHTAVYMGSLIRQKGIIELLKIWEIVEKNYPDAVLKIIGSGSLYEKGSKLGPLGIADAQLEHDMIPFICKENGRIKDNILFLGVLGEEKYDVFSKCAVGIVNPSANTETFGMGIIEMASSQLPVVTRGWNGHLDTIKNGYTGFTSFTINGMASKIITLFSDSRLNKKLGRNAKKFTKTFDPQLIAVQWYEHLNHLSSDNNINISLPISNPLWNNYKFLRYFTAFLRFNLGLHLLPSIVSIETCANDFIKKLRHS